MEVLWTSPFLGNRVIAMNFTSSARRCRGKSQDQRSIGKGRFNRRACFETLETRQLLSITLPTIANQTVLAGAPLNLGLDVTSSTGNAVNYTVSASNPALTATIPQGNPSLKLVVDYVGNPSDTSDDIHGTMVLQLSKDLTPKTVEKIIGLVNGSYTYNGQPFSYDNLIFHRIIKDFMIQGGDPLGTGSGGPGFKFDDEFNAALQFTSPGLLAMANSGDDTNGSQFFITTSTAANPYRSGDFNYTIFGVLTEGSDVLAKLNTVPTTSGTDKPTYNVVITDASIVTDTQNGVLRLSVPNGTTSGTAAVTVTATDSVTLESTSKTFNVTVGADTTNDPPFLGQINPIVTSVNTPVTFNIPATDVEGDAIYYYGGLGSTNDNLTVTVNSSTGQGTLTPTASSVPGVYSILVAVRATDNSVWDTQYVPVYVNPAAPSSITLLPVSDTGPSNSDRITSLNNTTGKTLQFQVDGVRSGATIELFSDGTLIGSAVASGTSVVIPTNASATLADGTRSITARQTLPNQVVQVGNLNTTANLVSSASTSLAITVDTTQPTDIALSNASVLEKLAVGAVVGTFSTTDPDAGDTFTYSLVSGDGSTDNASFTISGNTLKTAASFDRAVKSSYSIRVRSTDRGGLLTEKTLTINVASTDINLSAATVAEDAPVGTVIGTLTTVAPDSSGSPYTYSLVSGTGDADNVSFEIDGSTLKTKVVPNFETKATYNVRIRTTDKNSLWTEKAFTIGVTNANEAPTNIALSNTTVAENLAIGGTVGTFTTTDPDTGNTFTYSFVTGTGSADNAKFTIADGVLKTTALLDYEAQTSYSILVRSTDQGGLSTEKTFTIAVTNVNEQPTDLALSSLNVLEKLASGTTVGTLSTTDPDAGNTFTYSLASGDGGTDNASFSISGNTLKTAASFDYALKNSYSVRVRSTDQGGLSTEKTFTIAVTNVNEQPTNIVLSNQYVLQQQPSGTTVGTLSTTDPDVDNIFTYSLVSGEGSTDNASFSISGTALKTAASFDYAAKNSYSIRVRTTDQGGLWTEKALTIHVTNSLAPADISLSAATVAENAAVGTVVGALTTAAPDSSGSPYTYSLVSGTGDTDNVSFEIAGSALKTKIVPNFETKAAYSVRMRTTDKNGLWTEKVFAISVTNVNETPSSLALSNATVAENLAIGGTVGTFSTTDPDTANTFTYSFVSGTSGADNAKFTIDSNGVLKTSALLNYETQSSYSILVRSTDQGGLATDKSFTIAVTNVNEQPTAIALSNLNVVEKKVSGTVVGTLSTTDPDVGDTFTYSLVNGDGSTDNASFSISGNTLKTAASFDRALKSSYSIRVRSTDAAGLSTETTFTINVVAPASISGSIYLDGNGQGTTSSLAIPGVVVKLLTQASSSSAWTEVVGVSPVMTGADGAYTFHDLMPATYRVQEVQPTYWSDGKDTLGNVGGVARGVVGADQFDIQLAAGENAAQYNFSEQGLKPAAITIHLFLVPLRSVADVVTQLNVAPVIDLAKSVSGTGYGTTLPTGSSSVAIAAADATITHADGAMLAGMRAMISNPLDGSNEKLEINTSSLPITSVYANGVLTLSGIAERAVYEQALRSILYSNTAASPKDGIRKIAIIADDGIVDSRYVTAMVGVGSVLQAAVDAAMQQSDNWYSLY
jgi:cyclophilin family peptidyl-prolyl cis-trans isomerase